MKRDMTNKMILGVCSGLANEFGVDVTVMRFIFVIAALMGIGFPILIYIVLALLMPKN